MDDRNDDFYHRLVPIGTADGVFDEGRYAPAPPDWLLALSDIRDSTTAVAAGRHSEVNFAAAAMIAALTNLCGSIPYQFGGDGAVALVPPEHEAAARRVLAQTRSFAAREFKLALRVGLVPVAELTKSGASITVARYEPSPGSAYAVFRGGGIAHFERSVKGGGDPALARFAVIGDDEDDGEPPDLTGLSCRWTPVKSARGRMVSLVLRCADHAALHRDLALVAGVPSLNAVTTGGLKARWPPKGLMREARARHRKVPLPLMVLAVALETFLAFLVVHYRLKVGAFDPDRYVSEMEKGAVDFARSDETLCVVFDCPGDRVEAVQVYLDTRAARGDLNYGMHISDHAVMTCLVMSPTHGRHVHFVDGGDGGYTSAAIHLKAQLA